MLVIFSIEQNLLKNITYKSLINNFAIQIVCRVIINGT